MQILSRDTSHLSCFFLSFIFHLNLFLPTVGYLSRRHGKDLKSEAEMSLRLISVDLMSVVVQVIGGGGVHGSRVS